MVRNRWASAVSLASYFQLYLSEGNMVIANVDFMRYPLRHIPYSNVQHSPMAAYERCASRCKRAAVHGRCAGDR
ncbi:unnamed protein product [Toxocara canis]|uniref:Uncharacterized protein n=1 Tax=Toxocara canis TaxID=6265 RepID=A0A183V5Q0_TOXCA|nr:unnamed protein product [Toxocara canis]